MKASTHPHFGQRTLAAALLLFSITTAPAHHSGAMFDRSKTVTLNCTVKAFRFVAPHSWIAVLANIEGRDEPVRWDVETGPAGRMKALGLTPDNLKPGDKVIIRVHPLRDGRNAGIMIDIKLADGTVVQNNASLVPIGK